MSIFKQSYNDWKDFFAATLVKTGNYSMVNSLSKGGTDIEIYASLKDNLNTTIEIGYFSSVTLIYLNIFNPETPGKNEPQQIEHFYKYEFDQEKQYGPPGLDFSETNVQRISNYLDQGFNGREIVYYRNRNNVESTKPFVVLKLTPPA